MHARVVRFDVEAEKLDENTRIYRGVIEGNHEPGFKGACLLTDPHTGKSMSVTFWGSEEEMVQNEESGWWQAQVDKFKAVMKSPPVREHYEVQFATPIADIETESPRLSVTDTVGEQPEA